MVGHNIVSGKADYFEQGIQLLQNQEWPVIVKM